LRLSEEMNAGRRSTRIRFASTLAAAAFSIAVCRLARVQLIEHDMYAAVADAQHTHRVVLEPRRGRIFDRNGYILAGNRPVVTVEVYWPNVPPGREAEIDSLYARLSDTGTATNSPNRTGMNQVLARDIPWEDALPILTGPLPRGVNWTVGSRRIYPLGDAAASIIGRSGAGGTEGLEREFDDLLSGTSGVRFVERSAFAGMSITDPEADNIMPVDGADLMLTIDSRFQCIVQQELEHAVEESGGSWGAAVVMDPWNGDVLAMASCPVRTGNGAVEMNYCVEGMSEPGSTFKIVPLTACLEQGLVTPSDSFDCSRGLIEVADRSISDCHVYGVLSVEQIIAQSSNVGTIQLASLLPDSVFFDYCRDFGFGSPTGIELPGEQSGILREPSEWSGLSKACLAIGQEVAVTPLQLARAFCAIANGGVLVQPRLVAASSDQGQWRRWASFSVNRVMTPATAAEIRSILRTAVDSGTGTSAGIEGVSVAGKTGTAERLGFGRGAYLSAFVGMVPADNPRLVAAVVIDRPGYVYRFGSTLAAPAFARMMGRILSAEPGIALGHGVSVQEPGSVALR
jgi:cell division protein FtsI (penicillin-binding protein 3)